MKWWTGELLVQTEDLRNLFPTCTRGRAAHSVSQNHSNKNTDLVNEGKTVSDPMLFSFGTESDYLYTHTQTRKMYIHTHTPRSLNPQPRCWSPQLSSCVSGHLSWWCYSTNQTSLQCETWVAHTNTLIQACKQTHLSLHLYIYLLWVYVCVPNCLHQHL